MDISVFRHSYCFILRIFLLKYFLVLSTANFTKWKMLKHSLQQQNDIIHCILWLRHCLFGTITEKNSFASIQQKANVQRRKCKSDNMTGISPSGHQLLCRQCSQTGLKPKQGFKTLCMKDNQVYSPQKLIFRGLKRLWTSVKEQRGWHSLSPSLHMTHVDCLDLFQLDGPQSWSPEERSKYFVW